MLGFEEVDRHHASLEELLQHSDISAVSWFLGEFDKFLTTTGYHYYYRQAKAQSKRLDELLHELGYRSIADYNKGLPNYDRYTLWVDPAGNLLKRRDYANYVYKAKKMQMSTEQYLKDFGFIRLRKDGDENEVVDGQE